MTRLGAVVFGLLVVSCATDALADSRFPFANQRVVSPNGRRYVVIRESEPKGIRFELCARRSDLPPLPGVIGGLRAELAAIIDPTLERTVARDERDALLADGTVECVPLDVAVLDRGGFVLIDSHHSPGRGAIVTFIDDRGRVATRKTLVDVFGGVPSRAFETIGALHWCRGYWIDPLRFSIVFVAFGNDVREVALRTGVVTTPRPNEFIGWCTTGAAGDRCLALEVVPTISPPIACVVAARVVRDPREPTAVRLRAAVVLKRERGERAHGRLFVDALRAPAAADRRYAARHALEVFGDAALPHLGRFVVHETDYRASHAGWNALHAYGDRAVPTLIGILDFPVADSRFWSAVWALERMGSPAAVPALQSALGRVPGEGAAARCLRRALERCRSARGRR